MFAKCIELLRFPLSDSRVESISFTLVNITYYYYYAEVTIITTLVITYYILYDVRRKISPMQQYLNNYIKNIVCLMFAVDR